MFEMVLGLSPSDRELCSQSTISRLDNLQNVRTLLRMGRAMVDLYCESFHKVPKRITLDIDDRVLVDLGGLPGTALEDAGLSVQEGLLPLMDHRRMHAMFGSQFRHRALTLHGFQHHASLEARILVPAFAPVLISSSLEIS
jgi:hypothetical protein